MCPFPFLEAELEYEEDLAYLTGRVGATEEDARLRLRDGDLWILDAHSRFGEELEGEEGVRQWQRVAQLAKAFGELAANNLDRSNPAATQLIWAAADRAEEALRRARARLEASSASEE